MCREPDLNRHGLNRAQGILSPLRLPFRHPGEMANLRQRGESNPFIAVLQTAAFPLGYAAKNGFGF